MTEPIGYVGRFAPTTNGPLHFGSLIAAVASYLDAKHHGGKWLLRFDDLDNTRCKPEFAQRIEKQLATFGLIPDAMPVFQHAHITTYQKQIDQWIESKQAYWCDCTRAKINKAANIGPAGPIYPATCRDKQLNSNSGRMVRYGLNETLIEFDDLIQGKQVFDLAELCGDFVLKRADNVIAYHLANVINDQQMGVTHVVRGADLLYSTPNHVLLANKLGFNTPSYAHFPVAKVDACHKISKSEGAKALDEHYASELLVNALSFLNQKPEPTLRTATPASILEWGTNHWNLSALPAVEGIVCDV